MLKKWWNSFCYSLALAILILLLVSLMLPQIIQAKILWYMVCIITPLSVFSFFTFELKLFSKHMWVRRAIVMCFSVVNILTSSTLFGYMCWNDKRDWLIYGITLPITVLLMVFTYYVADKIEKRNLAAINQKLANGNMDANKK